jgi:Amt family ammonium transporter
MSVIPILVFCVAALLLLMQAGFALVTTGLCRAKNAGQLVLGNLMIATVSILAFWICGHAIMFGGHLFQTTGETAGGGSHLFVLQALLVSMAAVIPAGAMAERWSFRNMVWYGFFAGALPIAIFGRWVWGGGWLAQLGQSCGLGQGVVDFAGSSVIHMSAGMMALAGSLVLGARAGKYSRDGRPRPMPGHNLVFVVIGTVILFAGWFGFNAAPALAGERLEVIVVNTLLAAVAGAFAAYATTTAKFGKPDPSMICNGLLAGLVAISAACPFVNSIAAALIGAIAGFIVVHSVLFFEGKLKIDDPVGAISTHGVGGAWGLISAGLFASGGGVSGAFGKVFGGPANDWSQLAAQCVGMMVCLLFVGGLAWVWFKISNLITPIRTRRDFETGGLDLPETGAECYPDFHLTDKSSINPPPL